MTNRDLQVALLAFNEADEAWHKTLVAAFGVEGACERRYDSDKSAHPQECRDAYAAFRKANAAYIGAIEDVG